MNTRSLITFKFWLAVLLSSVHWFVLNHVVAASNLAEVPPVLPNISKPYLQREVTLSADEFPLSQRLRPLLEQGAYGQAIEELATYSDPKSEALLLLEAQLHMQVQNWNKAESTLLKVLKTMPDVMRAHLSLSAIYQVQNNVNSAKASLIRAISLGATDAKHFALLGYLHIQSNDSHAAVSAYQQALMLAPDDNDIRQGLLFALVNSDQVQAADNLLSGMLAIEPGNSKLWLQRANFALKQDKLVDALTHVEVALRLGAKDLAAKQLAMQLHLQQDSYTAASQYAQSLLQINALSFSELNKLCVWLGNKQQWQVLSTLLASEAITKAKLGSNERAIVMQHQAAVAKARDKLARAEKLWKQAIELESGNAEALLGLATLALEQNRFAAAELYYQRAETINHINTQARLGRVQVYLAQLDYQSALTLLTDVVADNPHRQDLIDNIRIIRNLLTTHS
ncbi:MAG: tetratricopeptide repeat protein [Alteromonadaceae bacterium]|nr:tetratricopeptide repeat protein [Alteromonadaceae bacterium]